jgi:hypothetical protein
MGSLGPLVSGSGLSLSEPSRGEFSVVSVVFLLSSSQSFTE